MRLHVLRLNNALKTAFFFSLLSSACINDPNSDGTDSGFNLTHDTSSSTMSVTTGDGASHAGNGTCVDDDRFDDEGEGTEAEPFLICNATQLKDLADRLKKPKAETDHAELTKDTVFRLETSIDFTNVSPFVIGDSINPFRGRFQGNFKSLSNLKSQDSLFGVVDSAQFSYLTIKNFDIEGLSSLGTLAKSAYNSEANDLSVQDSIVAGESFLGGLFGVVINKEPIARNFKNINVSNIKIKIRSNANPNAKVFGSIGGISGMVNGYALETESPSQKIPTEPNIFLSNIKIKNVEFFLEDGFQALSGQRWSAIGGAAGRLAIAEANDVDVDGLKIDLQNLPALSVGGIAGYVAEAYAKIAKASAKGEITALYGQDVGGLVGSLSKQASIKESSADVHVTGYRTVGGFAGRAMGSFEKLNGLFQNISIEDCFSKGALQVSAGEGNPRWFGGFIGFAQGTIIRKSYSTSSITSAVLTEDIGGFAGSVGEKKQNNLSANLIDFYYWGAIHSPQSNRVGGLIGTLLSSNSIQNAYAWGEVHGANDVAGLVGSIEQLNAPISYAFAATQIEATGPNVSGTVNLSAANPGATFSELHWVVKNDNAPHACAPNNVTLMSSTTCIWKYETSVDPDNGFYSNWDFGSVWKWDAQAEYPLFL